MRCARSALSSPRRDVTAVLAAGAAKELGRRFAITRLDVFMSDRRARDELAPFHCPMPPVLPTERIAITPPIIFSKEVAQNRPPHFPARTSSPPEIVSDQISGDEAWMNFRFSRALPPGASRSRRDERHSIRWTLPGRTTYLPRPRRRRLRCRRPRKGGRHAVRCSGLRQTWPPSCARSCRPPELL